MHKLIDNSAAIDQSLISLEECDLHPRDMARAILDVEPSNPKAMLKVIQRGRCIQKPGLKWMSSKFIIELS